MRQWLTKHKKSRQPSQQPAAFRIPSHIGAVPLGINLGLAPGVGLEGALPSFNRRGVDLTTVAGMDNEASSTHTGDVIRGCPLLQTDGPMLRVRTAVREWEPKQEVPSRVLDKQPSHNVPDLSSTQRHSEAQHQPTDSKQSSEMPPRPASEDDPIGQCVQATAQSEKCEGE